VLSRNHSKVLIIGSDCIELTESIIQAAFYQLNTKDVVIGPANDGGYYLLGMRRLHSELFINKKWSTDKVYRATVNNFNELGLSYYELPVLIDIDTKEDWLQAMQKTKKCPGK
ncbi:MAG: glycosyltransferase, partial [Bacteroidota bacterium]|nr:glycosyltransferase [Bacteroidota bacterium]